MKKRIRPNLTKQLIDEMLIIDAEHGTAKWLKPNGGACGKQFAGTTPPVGANWNNPGYTKIKIKGFQYLLHRIIWVYVFDEIPNGQVIDHKDGNPRNNRISNLQCVSFAHNIRRQKPHKNSRFKYPGLVYFSERYGYKYSLHGQCSVDWYATQYEAFAAYFAAKASLYGRDTCAHIEHLLQ